MSKHYAHAIDQLTRAHLLIRARAFIAEYNPQWPTVVILPGGMGSELSTTDDALSSMSWPWTTPPRVRPVWIAIAEFDRILKGDPLLLELDEYGWERSQRPCISTGALQQAGPYPRVFAGLETREVNFVDFGFDWRKFSRVAASYLELFLAYLDSEARAAHKPSPLPVGIFAHSQGGLVAKLFADNCAANDDGQANFSKQRYRFIVTAGTPFFGTLDHTNRYYTGLSNHQKKLLNLEFILMSVLERREDAGFGGAWMSALRKWRTLVASFPGLYGLVPSAHLANPEVRDRLGLDVHPVVDAATNEPVHLFADADRLPQWLRQAYAAHRVVHEREARDLAQPLSGYARERFFCVRGIGRGSQAEAKPLSLRLNRDVQTEHEFNVGKVWSVLSNKQHVALQLDEGDNTHDGVVPGWSAVLDINHQVMTIQGAQHRQIVREPLVLDLVANLAYDQGWGLAGGDSQVTDEQSPEIDEEMFEQEVTAGLGKLEPRQ